MFELKKIEAEWRARMHKGLYFDGKDDYVEVADSPSLDITDEITVEVWVKPSSFPTKQCPVFGQFAPGGSRNYLYISKTGEIVWDQYPPSGGWLKGSTLSTDVWYHIVVVQKPGFRAIFLNGDVDSSDNSPETYAGSKPDKHRIGSGVYDWKNYHFNGIIAEVRIYNRALSESEIKYLYHNPFDPIDPEHLVLWLNPAGIDVANSKWWDLSGKGNGTIHGATEVKLVEDEVIVK